MRRIVVICGGSGAYTELIGIRDLPDTEVTVVTTISDSGGSQGVFLDHDPQLIPLADVMKCLTALATDTTEASLMRYRYNGTHGDGVSEHGHTAGNIIWVALLKMGVSPRDAIHRMAARLCVASHHRVEPVAVQRTTLWVRLDNGDVIRGERRIDNPTSRQSKRRVVSAWHNPRLQATEHVTTAIRSADLVVIGPGDLYSSLVACLLPTGVSQALQETKAKVVYVANLMTKPMESYGMTARDFLAVIERYAGRQMDVVICNARRPSEDVARRYLRKSAIPVDNDLISRSGAGEVLEAELLDETGKIARHDSQQLATVLRSLLPTR